MPKLTHSSSRCTPYCCACGAVHRAISVERFQHLLDELTFIVSTVALFPCACGEQRSEPCTSCRARAVMQEVQNAQ